MARNVSSYPTYALGLLHARVYRLLKQRMNVVLEPFNITAPEWALLGVLFDSKKGIRSQQIAHMLGVDAPFVTLMVNKLKKKGLLRLVPDQTDARSKLIRLSEQGTRFIEKIEPKIRSSMRFLVKGLDREDLFSHLKVLERIIENDKLYIERGV